MVFHNLLENFDSAKNASIVSLSRVDNSPDWELQTNWVPSENERKSLTDFSAKHGISIRELKGFTFLK
jgi:hypothetical protein